MLEQGSQRLTELRLIAPTELGQTPLAYANFVQVTGTPHDFTFHFGWYATPPFTEPPQGSVDVEVRPVTKISVPLNLLRGIVRVLEMQAQAWEADMGQALPDNPLDPPSPASEPSEPGAADGGRS